MLWGTGQGGSNPDPRLNLTDVRPGDDYTLLDGTETVITGSTSIAFAAGYGPGGFSPTTFIITGAANGTQVTIEISNGIPTGQGGNPIIPFTFANFDATFEPLPGGVFTGNNSFTDVSSASFYRATIVLFVAGDAPVVVAKRR